MPVASPPLRSYAAFTESKRGSRNAAIVALDRQEWVCVMWRAVIGTVTLITRSAEICGVSASVGDEIGPLAQERLANESDVDDVSCALDVGDFQRGEAKASVFFSYFTHRVVSAL